MGRYFDCRLPLIAWGCLLLQLAANSLAAAPAISTQMTINGPPITGTISAPGEIKYFAIDTSIKDYYTFEVIAGTLPNHEIDEYWGYRIAYSHEYLYSTKLTIMCSGVQGVRYYVGVRATDQKSTGTFSIRVVKGPVLAHMKIDGGAISTPYRKVSINSLQSLWSASKPIAQCMISETPAFTGAAWQSYATAVYYTLSSGNGLKTVYMKCRNADGEESAIYADTIVVNEIKTLALDASALSSTLSISGEIGCFPFTVTSQGRYWIETTTLSGGPATASLYSSYLITQDAPYSGKPNTRVINRDLSPGSYVIKVKSPTPACAFTIRLVYGGSVTSFAVNDNNAETSSRLVTLNNTSLGGPTQMMASLSSGFNDGIWLPYSPNPTFKLNGYNGAKTVYFKVKFPSGAESEVKWDTITLNETIPLPPDGEWRTGNIYPNGAIDAYGFTIETAGDYTIETRCGSLKDTMLVLYNQNNMATPLDQDDDSGEHYAARISATLAPGAYVVKVTGHFMENGIYSIRVKRIP